MLFFKYRQSLYKDDENKTQKSQKEFISELDASLGFFEMSNGFLRRPEIERIKHEQVIINDFEENKETIMRARRVL